MLKNTIYVPVEATEPSDEDIASARLKLEQLKEDAEILSEFRRFFIALGMHGDKTMASYEMPSTVAEHAG